VVLDRSAPLFGRAREILRIGALGAAWIGSVLGPRDDTRAVEAYALWGGIPRYWELAADYRDPTAALRALVLSPQGVLHEEPTALLLDDLRDLTQASSILALVGAGCHRLSEIAGRLGKPATSLARPLARLVDLGLVCREVPFGDSPRDGKRTAYKIADPFLRFWFGYVEPNRSRLGAGQMESVAVEIAVSFALHVGGVWGDLVRESVPRARYCRRAWGPAARWWGAGLDRRPLEVDVVSESLDGKALLVGETTWSGRIDWFREAHALREKAARLPMAADKRVHLALWTRSPAPSRITGVSSFSPRDVLRVLR
jgi:DNA-binding transcriptional ArsR family regulator